MPLYSGSQSSLEPIRKIFINRRFCFSSWRLRFYTTPTHTGFMECKVSLKWGFFLCLYVCFPLSVSFLLLYIGFIYLITHATKPQQLTASLNNVHARAHIPTLKCYEQKISVSFETSAETGQHLSSMRLRFLRRSRLCRVDVTRKGKYT